MSTLKSTLTPWSGDLEQITWHVVPLHMYVWQFRSMIVSHDKFRFCSLICWEKCQIWVTFRSINQIWSTLICSVNEECGVEVKVKSIPIELFRLPDVNLILESDMTADPIRIKKNKICPFHTVTDKIRWALRAQTSDLRQFFSAVWTQPLFPFSLSLGLW